MNNLKDQMSFGEAFMLMWYACKCGHRERVWNSRDGITPFGIDCRSCGEIASHVDWELDQFEPGYCLNQGQRFFRDGTADEAEAIIRKRLVHYRGTPFEATPEKAEKLISMARSGDAETDFQAGWPTLDIRK